MQRKEGRRQRGKECKEGHRGKTLIIAEKEGRRAGKKGAKDMRKDRGAGYSSLQREKEEPWRMGQMPKKSAQHSNGIRKQGRGGRMSRIGKEAEKKRGEGSNEGHTGRTLTIAGGGGDVKAVGGGRGVGGQVGSGVQQTPFIGVQLDDVTWSRPTRAPEQFWRRKGFTVRVDGSGRREDGGGRQQVNGERRGDGGMSGWRAGGERGGEEGTKVVMVGGEGIMNIVEVRRRRKGVEMIITMKK